MDQEGMFILCGILGLMMLFMAFVIAAPLLFMAVAIAYLHHRTSKGWIRRAFLLGIVSAGIAGQVVWVNGIIIYDRYIQTGEWEWNKQEQPND